VANLERLRQAGIAFAWSRGTSRYGPRLGEVMRTLLDLRPAQVTLTPTSGALDSRVHYGAALGLRDAGEVWMTAFPTATALPLEPCAERS